VLHALIVEARGIYMKYTWMRLIMGMVIISGCAGCRRIIDWGKSNFYQGIECNWYKSEEIDSYIRSLTLYDELDTVGIFDVLWLADEVREVYTDLYVRRRGRTVEYKNLFLRRQLEENNHFIVFYILATDGLALASSDTEWSIILSVGNNCYNPLEIKRVDLTPEYKAFFGKRFNRFKGAYQVRFDAKDDEGKALFNLSSSEFSLILRSVNKEVVLTWTL
jgi:hypothetical protein